MLLAKLFAVLQTKIEHSAGLTGALGCETLTKGWAATWLASSSQQLGHPDAHLPGSRMHLGYPYLMTIGIVLMAPDRSLTCISHGYRSLEKWSWGVIGWD